MEYKTIKGLLESELLSDNRLAFFLIAKYIPQHAYLKFKEEVYSIMRRRDTKYFDHEYRPPNNYLTREWSFNSWARNLHTETYKDETGND